MQKSEAMHTMHCSSGSIADWLEPDGLDLVELDRETRAANSGSDAELESTDFDQVTTGEALKELFSFIAYLKFNGTIGI